MFIGERIQIGVRKESMESGRRGEGENRRDRVNIFGSRTLGNRPVLRSLFDGDRSFVELSR